MLLGSPLQKLPGVQSDSESESRALEDTATLVNARKQPMEDQGAGSRHWSFPFFSERKCAKKMHFLSEIEVSYSSMLWEQSVIRVPHPSLLHFFLFLPTWYEVKTSRQIIASLLLLFLLYF